MLYDIGSDFLKKMSQSFDELEDFDCTKDELELIGYLRDAVLNWTGEAV